MQPDPWEDAQAVSGNVCPKPQRLHPVHWCALHDAAASNYIIKGLIDSGAFSAVWGEPACGKSFFAIDCGMHVAFGWKWRGHRTRQCGVLYIAAEAGPGIGRRLAAFERHHDVKREDAPFFVETRPVNFLASRDDADELVAWVKASEAQIGLIVIDTLSRATPGNREDTEDMGRFVQNADRLREGTGAHVLVVHHSGKDEARGGRGSNVLKAAVDTEVHISKSQAAAGAVAKVIKQREGADGTLYGFCLEVVDLGEDDEGDPITSCIVAADDATKAHASSKLTSKQKRAVDQLRNCLVDHGGAAPDATNYPAGARVTSLDLWRENLLLARVIDPDGSNPRRDFSRLVDQLAAKGVIGIRGDHIWAAG